MPHDDIGFVLRFACLSVLPQLQHLQLLNSGVSRPVWFPPQFQVCHALEEKSDLRRLQLACRCSV